MPHSPGQKLGAYEVVSPLGAGGMGEVYRARDSKLKRDVAIKGTRLTPTTNIDQYAPSADGTRFLLRRPRGDEFVDRLEVIANWPTLVKAGTRH